MHDINQCNLAVDAAKIFNSATRPAPSEAEGLKGVVCCLLDRVITMPVPDEVHIHYMYIYIYICVSAGWLCSCIASVPITHLIITFYFCRSHTICFTLRLCMARFVMCGN